MKTSRARLRVREPGLRPGEADADVGGGVNVADVRRPQSLLVERGNRAEFEVDESLAHLDAARFQWFRNGAALDAGTAKELEVLGRNKPKLTIPSTDRQHVGFYICAIQVPAARTRYSLFFTEAAELMMFHHSVLTVFGTPIAGGGPGTGNCPPPYQGYISFRKTVAPYGWTLVNPAQGGTASDPQRADTTVRYFGSTLAKNGCGTGRVAVPPGSDVYRFTIYLPTLPVPSGPYAIQLDGFNP